PRLRTIKNDKYIFDPSPLFSNQSLVSVYLIDDYEELVGIGYVESVLQNTHMLQVIIMNYYAGYDLNKIENQRGRITLKPSIPYQNSQLRAFSEGENNE